MLKLDVSTHRLPVAIEGEAEDPPILVKDGATGVPPRDVVAGDEGDMELAILVCPTSPVTLLDEF